MFEEPVTRMGLNWLTVYRNFIPIVGVLLFLDRIMTDKKLFNSYVFSPYFVLGAVFSVCGITGWIFNRYQSFMVTAETMYEHLRFWICLFLFVQIFEIIDIEKITKNLFTHISIMSCIVITASALDFFFKIWPRQMYRYGTSSLQIFYGHPSNLGAHAIFLIGMLLVMLPYLIRETDNRKKVLLISGIETVLLLAVVFLTLRVRLFGFLVGFAILFIYIIVLKKKITI